MPKSRRRSGSRLGRAAAALAGAALLGLAGCAAPRAKSAGPAPTPGEVYLALLGHNPGLKMMRAVAEARISFSGRTVSFPGVLQLDVLDGFRLELLDPLDRPVAIVFSEGGRIVQFRPGQRLAASLGVFPGECRGVDAADWVGLVSASSVGPVSGVGLLDRGLWGGERSLELRRGGDLRQSIRYRDEGGALQPRLASWYCDEEPVLQARLGEWLQGAGWRLPTRIELDYVKAGLTVRIDLREIEANPPPTGQPLRPRLGSDIGWTSWNLPR